MSDLREQLLAAMGESPEPAAIVAPEPVEAPVSAAPEPVEATAEINAPEGAQPRDDKGKFAPKDGAAPVEAAAPPTETPETAEPADNEPPKEATRVPPSLPAAVKAKWATLEPDVQQAISKLEESVQTSKAEWGKKAERLNRYEEIIAPHRDAWAVQGLDDQQALTRLVAAEQVLRTNAPQGIVYLAQTYGVDLRQLVQTTGAPAPGAQPAYPGQAAPTQALSPELQPLLEKLQTLEQQVQQQTQSASAASLATVKAQIAEFSSKPENLYFENVREDVAKILETGQADTLEDAYQKAIWASPEIRPLLLSAETARAAKAAEDARVKAEADARAKATAAQHASGSVTGAPSPGAVAPRPGSSGNLRADLQAAIQEHSAV